MTATTENSESTGLGRGTGIGPGLVPESPDDRNHPSIRVPLWRSITRGQGLAGLALVLTVIALGVVGPLFLSYTADQQIDGAYLLPASGSHWFGTDDVNRDVLTRILYGIRVDLLIVFISVPVGAAVGTLLGLVSVGRSVTDVIAQRVFDVILAFPVLILGIALTAILGPGALTVGIVIALAEVPIFGRLTRTAVLRVREMPYV